MARLSITLGQFCLFACCIVSGCSVDLAKLRASAGDGGANRPAGDADRESALGDGSGSGLPQDGQAADRSGERSLPTDDGAKDVPVWPNADSAVDGTSGNGGAAGTDGGVQADAGQDQPVDADRSGSVDGDHDMVSSWPDTAVESRGDAAGMADLVFDSPAITSTDLAPADGPTDRRSETGATPDAPTDALQGKDLGTDLPSGTLPCPATMKGTLDSRGPVQIGRHSRIAPTSICGSAKDFPGNSADSTNSHLYDLYRFHNPSAGSLCFNFTLTYPGAQLYAAAYTQFNPSDITTGYLGDVGAVFDSPQTMGISVAGGATIEIVVYAIATGTSSAGSYTLSCSTP